MWRKPKPKPNLDSWSCLLGPTRIALFLRHKKAKGPPLTRCLRCCISAVSCTSQATSCILLSGFVRCWSLLLLVHGQLSKWNGDCYWILLEMASVSRASASDLLILVVFGKLRGFCCLFCLFWLFCLFNFCLFCLLHDFFVTCAGEKPDLPICFKKRVFLLLLLLGIHDDPNNTNDEITQTPSLKIFWKLNWAHISYLKDKVPVAAPWRFRDARPDCKTKLPSSYWSFAWTNLGKIRLKLYILTKLQASIWFGLLGLLCFLSSDGNDELVPGCNRSQVRVRVLLQDPVLGSNCLVLLESVVLELLGRCVRIGYQNYDVLSSTHTLGEGLVKAEVLDHLATRLGKWKGKRQSNQASEYETLSKTSKLLDLLRPLPGK